MVKFLSVKGKRNHSNMDATPENHWAELIFENARGLQKLELNGKQVLPIEILLRKDIEWLLFDYALLSQQDSRTARQRVRVAQYNFDFERLCFPLARLYMINLGATVTATADPSE